jgi:hypothetical protein
MSITTRRQLPPPELPFLNKDGTVNIDWYSYLKAHDQEHGGDRTDRLVRSPRGGTVTPGSSGISGASGTIELIIDGVSYNVVVE